jgi:hypothetical protein
LQAGASAPTLPLMFTIEHDFDATVITLVDDPATHRQEDITVTAFEDVVTLEQLDPGRTRCRRSPSPKASSATSWPPSTCPKACTSSA